MKHLYFNSPQESIPVIKELLAHEEWEELASYYDLSNSKLNENDLLSGKYFSGEDAMDVGMKFYSHPFSLDSQYESCYALHKDLYVVEMFTDISSEKDVKVKGMQYFFMQKKTGGYQIIPDVEDDAYII